jgi:hypothetical protein
LIETVDATGYGPRLHKYHEAEMLYILEGRHLFQVDGERVELEKGDTVVENCNVPHTFVKIDDRPSRQLVMIVRGFDALAFFTQLGSAMKGGKLDSQEMGAFCAQWGVDFLGPPLGGPVVSANASSIATTTCPTVPIRVRDIGSFHVGGHMISLTGMPPRVRVGTAQGATHPIDPNGEKIVGQMYVQYVKLAEPSSRHPLLLRHGCGISGVN